jgi:hypothetical protein
MSTPVPEAPAINDLMAGKFVPLGGATNIENPNAMKTKLDTVLENRGNIPVSFHAFPFIQVKKTLNCVLLIVQKYSCFVK